jgi:hypothetical protein
MAICPTRLYAVSTSTQSAFQCRMAYLCPSGQPITMYRGACSAIMLAADYLLCRGREAGYIQAARVHRAHEGRPDISCDLGAPQEALRAGEHRAHACAAHVQNRRRAHLTCIVFRIITQNCQPCWWRHYVSAVVARAARAAQH